MNWPMSAFSTAGDTVGPMPWFWSALRHKCVIYVVLRTSKLVKSFTSACKLHLNACLSRKLAEESLSSAEMASKRVDIRFRQVERQLVISLVVVIGGDLMPAPALPVVAEALALEFPLLLKQPVICGNVRSKLALAVA